MLAQKIGENSIEPSLVSYLDCEFVIRRELFHLNRAEGGRPTYCNCASSESLAYHDKLAVSASANREPSLPIVPDPTQVMCPSAVNAVPHLKNWKDPRYDANYAAHEDNEFQKSPDQDFPAELFAPG